METFLTILKIIITFPALYSLYLAIGTAWFGIQSKDHVQNAAKKHRVFRNRFTITAIITLLAIEILIHLPCFHGHHYPMLFSIHMYFFVLPTIFLLVFLWGRLILRKCIPRLARQPKLHYLYGYLFAFFYTGAFITGGIQLYLF